jgi:hypothetical protein
MIGFIDFLISMASKTLALAGHLALTLKPFAKLM